MMTDPYRVAFVRISACISVSFHSSHSSIHANLNVYLLLECPPCNLSYIILPRPILVFHHTAADLFVFFHLLINIWPCQTLHYFSRLLFLAFAQHLSAGLLPFLPLSANHLSKNLQSSSLIFLQANTRTRTCVRLSMYLLPLAVFISHQKEGFC